MDPPASAKTTLAIERYEQGLQDGIPMFMFDPQLLSRFAMDTKLGPEYSQNAIRPIMKAIVIRSTIFTETILPDGTKTSVGKDMPDIIVSTVELVSRSGETRASVMSFIEKAQSQMFIKAKDVLATHLGQGRTQSAPKNLISGNIWRRLGLASTSIDFIHATTPRARVVKMIKDFGAYEDLVKAGIKVSIPGRGKSGQKRKRSVPASVLAKTADKPTLTPEEVAKEQAEANKHKPDVAAGTKEVNMVAA